MMSAIGLEGELLCFLELKAERKVIGQKVEGRRNTLQHYQNLAESQKLLFFTICTTFEA